MITYKNKNSSFTLIEHERSKSARRNESFTLIELLVVIAVIGMLASIVLVQLGPARTKGRVAKTQSELDAMRQAMMMYMAEYEAPPPCTRTTNTCAQCCPHCGGDATCFTNSFVNPLAAYAKIPVYDPWGNPYWYHYHPDSNECNFIMSLGPNKTGDWGSEHNCVCDDDDICLFFGRGTQ